MNYENEEWRDIKFTDTDGKEYDYSGIYQVSNLGRVRSLDRIDANGHRLKGKIMQYKPGKSGYILVNLHKNGTHKKFQVHRLVAHMFIPNNDKTKKIVNHKDENKSNNCIENLEWCTYKYNSNYGTNIKRRTEKQKGSKRDKISELYKGNGNPAARKVICVETRQVFQTCKEAGEWCGVGVSAISHCCKGRNKTSKGYHWQYYEDYLREQRMQSDINNSKLVA